MPQKRVYDARPDSMDFRDEMFIPTLVNVPAKRSTAHFRRLKLPVLDQGTEGACTGFALATVCHYLLQTVTGSNWDGSTVSARMFYIIARRYDEWPGTDYDGSSARGAVKGWHKHGVCRSQLWPNSSTANDDSDRLTASRAEDAAHKPLGAYFRVNHRDLVSMHAAINEVGILFATSLVHEGWDNVGSDGVIEQSEKSLGGHAFVIVGYDEDGFWIQNSWGKSWGKDGLAHVSYSDWLSNGMDAWVARLGVPVRIAQNTISTARRRGIETSRYSQNQLRNHIVSVGNDGALRQSGAFATVEADIEEIFSERLPQLTRSWQNPRILLYAHGGLVSEKSAIEGIESNLPKLLENEIYPISFVWKTDFWSTLRNVLGDALRRRKAAGLIDASKDFMLDRLDDALEPLTRLLGGRMLWKEMKENALLATTSEQGAARLVAEYLAAFDTANKFPIHLVSHSAGSIFMAPFAQLLASPRKGVASGPMRDYQGFAVDIASCHLWAPACTVELFNDSYLPLINSGAIRDTVLYTLTDEAEQDDHSVNIYHKSVLYLVSNALEDRHRVPLIRKHGMPLAGMQKFVAADKHLQAAIDSKRIRHVLSPNDKPTGQCDAARTARHGDFDQDVYVRLSTLYDILGHCDVAPVDSPLELAETIREKREDLNQELLSLD